MTPTKFLIGQFFLTLALIVLSFWAATQWTAEALGFQPRLGRPWFVLGEYPVYRPWRFFQWWYAYDAYASGIFARGGIIASLGGIAGIVMAVIASLLRARQKGQSTTYGSARWATRTEIRQARLFSASGVILGRLGRRYLRHDGPEHVMAFAPTRSGKGVGLVVPTLLSWTDNAVIHDIKGENWQLTSAWRGSFSRCIRFDPTDLSGERFNPLLEIRSAPHDVRDAQNIADILVDPEGALQRRSHWDKTAHSLLTGAILHVLYAGEDKTLAGVAALLSDPSRPVDETLEDMICANHLGTGAAPRPHPVVAQAAREVLNKSENERSSVISTALSFLGLYRDPLIARATSASDWKIADLLTGARPVSLYLIVPPSELSRTRPLIRLVLNQITRRLCEALPEDGTPRRRTLLMLDEFPALGRLDFFETALSFMAGYGVRAFLIAQSLNQVENAYGENNAILDNCHVRVAFAANNDRTARRISDLLGAKTEQRHQRNYAGHRLAPWLSHVMVSQQETQRALMTPGEILQLSPRQALILVAGTPPVRASKLRYYEDLNFIRRAGALPLPGPDSGSVPGAPPHPVSGFSPGFSSGPGVPPSAATGLPGHGLQDPPAPERAARPGRRGAARDEDGIRKRIIQYQLQFRRDPDR